MSMRIRLVYAKTALLRYTGALDMQTSWERTLRRARLPIAYSQGFHPQPRINQASALPLGFTSRAEMIDLWLDIELPLDQVRSALIPCLPPGVELVDILPVVQGAPSVQTVTQSAEYLVSLLEPLPPAGEIQTQVTRLLQADRLPRRRREKTYDLRPLIEALQIMSSEDDRSVTLWMRLSAREAFTGRPDEVLDEMGILPANTRIERTRLTLSA
jgi:radical SAM-linked protein